MAGRAKDWGQAVHRRPTPLEVAKLHSSDGLEICVERWGYLCPRTVSALVRKGKRLLEEPQHALN